jgi:hypothetical protein
MARTKENPRMRPRNGAKIEIMVNERRTNKKFPDPIKIPALYNQPLFKKLEATISNEEYTNSPAKFRYTIRLPQRVLKGGKVNFFGMNMEEYLKALQQRQGQELGQEANMNNLFYLLTPEFNPKSILWSKEPKYWVPSKHHPRVRLETPKIAAITPPVENIHDGNPNPALLVYTHEPLTVGNLNQLDFSKIPRKFKITPHTVHTLSNVEIKKLKDPTRYTRRKITVQRRRTNANSSSIERSSNSVEVTGGRTWQERNRALRKQAINVTKSPSPGSSVRPKVKKETRTSGTPRATPKRKSDANATRIIKQLLDHANHPNSSSNSVKVTGGSTWEERNQAARKKAISLSNDSW